MSLVVVAHLHARAGKEDDLLELLTSVIAATHDEEGCGLYALHRDVEDAQAFTMVEKWAGEEALGAHFETDHLKSLLARADELLDQPPVIKTHVAVPIGGDKGAL